jgi:AraC-like DNA-binding protein
MMSEIPSLISTLPAHRPIAVWRKTRCDVADHPGGEVVHDHSALAVYLAGATRMWMRRDYRLVRGDVLLIPEGTPHCAREASEGDRLGVMLCTGCMKGAWGEYLSEAFNEARRGGVAVRRLTEDGLAEVERLIGALDAELRRSCPHQELMLDGLMSQLTAQIARAAPGKVSAAIEQGCPRVVADALEFIEKGAVNAVSLKEVAGHVGRSPAHLATLMKQHTGRTVVEWITHARMALARQLLLSSEDGVEAIAEQVGYASASHFHRTFRRLHQATPGEWRQAHRSGGDR